MRRPKLRKKKVKGHEYWYTAAAGGAYFGKVGEVAHKDAYRHFAEHTQKGQANSTGTLNLNGDCQLTGNR